MPWIIKYGHVNRVIQYNVFLIENLAKNHSVCYHEQSIYHKEVAYGIF